jgi:cholesterol oxidase
MRLGQGTGNAFASAFGGSSAVNYGITVQPDDHVFGDWPISAADLAPYFKRAKEVLKPTVNPIADELGDKDFLDLVEPGHRHDIENTIDWPACTQCGRCVPGCNEDAKNSLDKNYLAMAMDRGAEVRLETEVRDIVPLEKGYAVELCSVTSPGHSEWVRCRELVLAAGTLGTLDILHRAPIELGPLFGKNMSMNGDGLAFLYNLPNKLSSHSGAPISTSVRIPFHTDDGRLRTLMVMSGRVPMAAMRFAGAALSVASGIVGQPPRDRAKPLRRWGRRLRDLLRVDGHGALSHSFMYKLDGQDGSNGTARFTEAGAVIDWPDYLDDPVNRFAEERLRTWADKVGGVVVPNVARLPGMRSFSVHPLGGCRMGTDLANSVVDDVGRPYKHSGGVHESLRIVDGSILAGSLGVPPSLTITAVAERIADDMIGAQVTN